MKLLQNMFIRKVIGALLGTIVGSVIFTLTFEAALRAYGFFPFFLYILLVAGGYMFFGGFTVSVVSDFITLRLSGWFRGLVSALFYLGIAVYFTWLTEKYDQFIFAILFSTAYWLIDEWLLIQSKRNSDKNSTPICNGTGVD